MTDPEIIARLTRKNLELEDECIRRERQVNRRNEIIDELRNYLRAIASVLNYKGHDGNLASTIQERLS